MKCKHKDGEQCKNEAVAGGIYCSEHAEELSSTTTSYIEPDAPKPAPPGKDKSGQRKPRGT